MLARQDASYRALANRFHTVFFLATPHRGSNLAHILKRTLQVVSTSPGYVGDLERGSRVMQSINDDFRHYSGDIDIKSFYETSKLKIGLFKSFIVDKDS